MNKIRLNKVWEKVSSREGVDLLTINGVTSAFHQDIKDFTGLKDELYFAYFNNNEIVNMLGVNKYDLGKAIFEKDFNSIKKIKSKYEYGEQMLAKAQADMDSTGDGCDKENMTQLAQEFKADFYGICLNFTVNPFLAFDAWQEDFDKKISSLIEKNNLQAKKEQIIFSIYQPWKDTALIEIAKKLKAGVAAQEIVKDYQFLRGWAAIAYRTIDEEWVEGLANPEVKAQMKILSKDEIIELLHPSEENILDIELASYIVFFKDWRDDMRRKFSFTWSKFFELISKHFEIKYDDIGYLNIDELVDCLENDQFNHDLVKQRRGTCIVRIADDGESTKVLSDHIEKYLKIYEESSRSNSAVIKGQVAFAGNVRGKVKILKSYHDVKDFVEGDILVAVSTHPNYLPAMKKASAFVTDEGSIISHAAIVARELKKPCIVGTKFATKQLKDGDIIEVDANDGIVRKIKN